MFAALAFLLTFALVTAIYVRSMPSDIGVHVQFILASIVTGEWLPNWLFFRSVAIASSWSTDYNVLMLFTLFFLGAAVAAKYLVSVAIGRRWLATDMALVPPEHRRRMDALLCGTLFLMLWAFNLPVGGWREYYYIGQFPPNVWHNSTTMFLMPFALALLWAGWRYLQKPSRWLLLGIVVLSVLNLLAKPSFVMTFGVAFPIMVVARYRFRLPTLETFVAMLVPAAVMAMQANALFVEKESAQSLGGVAWTPFMVWGAFTDNYVLSLAVSLLFPLCAFAAHPKIAMRSTLFRFVVLNFIVGLLIYSLLSETGPRQWDANFSWQVIVAMYMLFLVSVLISFRGWTANGGILRLPDWIVVGAFLLHVMSGILYLSRWFVLKNYL